MIVNMIGVTTGHVSIFSMTSDVTASQVSRENTVTVKLMNAHVTSHVSLVQRVQIKLPIMIVNVHHCSMVNRMPEKIVLSS